MQNIRFRPKNYGLKHLGVSFFPQDWVLISPSLRPVAVKGLSLFHSAEASFAQMEGRSPSHFSDEYPKCWRERIAYFSEFQRGEGSDGAQVLQNFK